MRCEARMLIGRHDRMLWPHPGRVTTGGTGNLIHVLALDSSAALTQQVEIDLFQGPFAPQSAGYPHVQQGLWPVRVAHWVRSGVRIVGSGAAGRSSAV